MNGAWLLIQIQSQRIIKCMALVRDIIGGLVALSFWAPAINNNNKGPFFSYAVISLQTEKKDVSVFSVTLW